MKLMDFTKIALKNLFSKPATSNYPFEPAVYPERSRGHVEINIDDCIMCGMCMRKCPSGAITVDRNKKEWSIEEWVVFNAKTVLYLALKTVLKWCRVTLSHQQTKLLTHTLSQFLKHLPAKLLTI